MRIFWVYGRRLVEWLCLSAIGHGIILFLATYNIYPDKFVASMLTTVTEAPVWADWIMSGAFGLLFTLILEIFFWNRRKLEAARVIPADVPISKPVDNGYDAPIWEAFEHVAASINESRTGYDLPKTRSLIRQKAINGHLKIWGKKQLDGGQEWVETRKFDAGVTEIPKQYWNTSKISAYATTDNKHVNNPYTLPLYPDAWPNEKNTYADFRVNFSQVKQLWPS